MLQRLQVRKMLLWYDRGMRLDLVLLRLGVRQTLLPLYALRVSQSLLRSEDLGQTLLPLQSVRMSQAPLLYSLRVWHGLRLL